MRARTGESTEGVAGAGVASGADEAVERRVRGADIVVASVEIAVVTEAVRGAATEDVADSEEVGAATVEVQEVAMSTCSMRAHSQLSVVANERSLTSSLQWSLCQGGGGSINGCSVWIRASLDREVSLFYLWFVGMPFLLPFSSILFFFSSLSSPFLSREVVAVCCLLGWLCVAVLCAFSPRLLFLACACCDVEQSDK